MDEWLLLHSHKTHTCPSFSFLSYNSVSADWGVQVQVHLSGRIQRLFPLYGCTRLRAQPTPTITSSCPKFRDATNHVLLAFGPSSCSPTPLALHTVFTMDAAIEITIES